MRTKRQARNNMCGVTKPSNTVEASSCAFFVFFQKKKARLPTIKTSRRCVTMELKSRHGGYHIHAFSRKMYFSCQRAGACLLNTPHQRRADQPRGKSTQRTHCSLFYLSVLIWQVSQNDHLRSGEAHAQIYRDFQSDGRCVEHLITLSTKDRCLRI